MNELQKSSTIREAQKMTDTVAMTISPIGQCAMSAVRDTLAMLWADDRKQRMAETIDSTLNKPFFRLFCRLDIFLPVIRLGVLKTWYRSSVEERQARNDCGPLVSLLSAPAFAISFSLSILSSSAFSASSNTFLRAGLQRSLPTAPVDLPFSKRSLKGKPFYQYPTRCNHIRPGCAIIHIVVRDITFKRVLDVDRVVRQCTVPLIGHDTLHTSQWEHLRCIQRCLQLQLRLSVKKAKIWLGDSARLLVMTRRGSLFEDVVDGSTSEALARLTEII